MQNFSLAATILIAAASLVAAKPSQQLVGEQPVVNAVVHKEQHSAVDVAAPAMPHHAAPTVPVLPVPHHVSAVAPIVAAEPSVIVHHAPHNAAVVSQYSPAAVVSVVSGESAAPAVAGVKPAVVAAAAAPPSVSSSQVAAAAAAVASGEQYGQPESAAIPANYKPFGSWGLYIGGNPADGYYTNYYKSLSNSVEKQVGVGAPTSVVDKQIRAGLNPILKQASSSAVSNSPYQGADYYPFSYSALDFASNPAFAPHALSYSSIDSPLVSSYIPEPYSTKRAGSAPVKGGSSSQHQSADSQQQHQVKSVAKGQQQQQQQSPLVPHFYSAPISGAAAVPAVASQQPQQAQVVAYPVPVGSQIVGSQVGVDGAFFPYGVHAFTKYAIKPTVVDANAQAAAAAAAAYQQHQPSVYHSSSGAYSPAQLAVVQPGYKFAAHVPSSSVVGSSIHQHPSYYSSSAGLFSGLSGYYAYPAAVHDFE